MQNGLNFLFALQLERVIDRRQEISKKTIEGWQLFLAEARKRFLFDELILKNNLSTYGISGEILEVDDGISKLGTISKRHGLRFKRVNLLTPSEELPLESYALGVSHNHLEHYPDLNSVGVALEFLKDRSAYGMVHQVHAIDDPAFEWDRTHHLRMTSDQWEDYFREWANKYSNEGWVYLGNHRGASGRPKNHVLERNGSLPFYNYYDQQTVRKIIVELTLSNGISASRIPLLLISFSIARNNPYLLAGLVGVVHAMDALDGKVARKGLGNSPLGPHIDIETDHVIEGLILFHYAYSKNYIPKSSFWVLSARNLSTDFLRLYNAFRVGFGTTSANPHQAFGTENRLERLSYGLIKAIGDVAIPIIPKLGLEITATHIGASLARAIPVWTSTTSQQIYREFLDAVLNGSIGSSG